MKSYARSVYNEESRGTVGITTQGALILGILLYGLVLQAKIPERFHFLANAVAAVLAVAVGYGLGLSFDELGLGLHVVLPGILVAVVVSVAIMLAVFGVASVPQLRRNFRLIQHLGPSQLAYETAVRIPLSTALSEEILFRGVLLGVLFTSYSTLVSVAVASLTFGLWHILPSLSRHRSQHQNGSLVAQAAYAAATVGLTAIAGMFFSWLRIIAGSIIAPWLTHWSINASAMLASAAVKRVYGGKTSGSVKKRVD